MFKIFIFHICKNYLDLTIPTYPLINVPDCGKIACTVMEEKKNNWKKFFVSQIHKIFKIN